MMAAKIGTKDQIILGQFDMFDSEALGLIKFDILGLDTLDVLADTERMIREEEDASFSFDSIDLDDPAGYDLLAAGRTAGVFQASGGGFGRLLGPARPRSVEDLAVLTSLCRPGPTLAGATESYIKRRQGLEQITYPIPELESILGKNLGVLTFQEDIMAIAHQLAGFTLAEADELRKVMGKKQIEKMPRYRMKFIDGLLNTSNISPHEGEKLWDQLVPMAQYVFNRAHAMAYSYTTAKCLAGDTKIPLLDGTSPTIEELSHRKRSFWVYANDGQQTVPARGHHARLTGCKPTVEIVLDDGEIVRCTADHKIMLRFGLWSEAGDLMPGDRLMPLYRKKLKAKGKSGKQYEEVYHPGLDLWEMTHRMVARNTQHDAYFASMKKRHIDHINDNESDNRPENLQVMSEADHLRKTVRDNWALRRENCVRSNQEQWKNPEARANASVARKAWWGNLTPEQRTAHNQKNADGHRGKPWSEKRRAAMNHTIVEVRPGPVMDVYDLTVDGYHNFAIEQGIIVHNCVWSKAHYPAYFLAAAMSADTTGTNSGQNLPIFVRDAQLAGCSFIAPEINKAERGYRALGKTEIMLGLRSVRDVGPAAVEAIIAERERGGPFKSRDDLRNRLPPKSVNKKVLEALVTAGAFDSLEGTARESTEERLHEEFALFGFYLSGHPCARQRQSWLETNPRLSTLYDVETDYKRERAFKQTQYGRRPVFQFAERHVRAIVSRIEKKKSKKTGAFMLMLDIEDETGAMKMIVNAKQLQKFGNPTIAKGSLLDVVGRKEDPNRWAGYFGANQLRVV